MVNLDKIPQNVQPRLIKAINELLNAGRNTAQVTEVLKLQQSFGKYDGCTPLTIRAIADEICREINAKIKVENKVMMAEATRSLREAFPNMAKYFKK